MQMRSHPTLDILYLSVPPIFLCVFFLKYGCGYHCQIELNNTSSFEDNLMQSDGQLPFLANYV
jgi:hypothetical protein